MDIKIKREDLHTKIKSALDKTTLQIIADTKANNSYIVVSGKDGKPKKIFAKDL